MKTLPTLTDNRSVQLLVTAALILIVIAGLRYVGPLFAPVFFAFTLVILFYPILKRLTKLGLPKGLAILVLVALVVAFFTFFISVLIWVSNQIAHNIPHYAQSFEYQVRPIVDRLNEFNLEITTPSLHDWQNLQRYLATAANFATGLVMNVIFTFIFLFALLMMLIGADDVVTKVGRRLGPSHDFVIRFQTYCQLIQKQYAIQTFSNFISAAAITILLYLFNIDFPLVWGLLAFVLGYIPNIGLTLAMIPAALLALVLHGPATMLLMLVLAAFLSQLMDNAVTPRFMGKGLDLPILFVFLSFIFWTWMFGAFGTLISLPLTLAIRTFIAQGTDKPSLMAELMSGQKN